MLDGPRARQNLGKTSIACGLAQRIVQAGSLRRVQHACSFAQQVPPAQVQLRRMKRILK